MAAFAVFFALTDTGYFHDLDDSPLDASFYESAVGRTVCDKKIGRVCCWAFMDTIVDKGISHNCGKRYFYRISCFLLCEPNDRPLKVN